MRLGIPQPHQQFYLPNPATDTINQWHRHQFPQVSGVDMKNIVFIGTSLDGYIADKNGGFDFLNSIPNPEQDDFGYLDFMDRIDALLMGRKTYETVLGFGGQWPYNKPVFVLSNTLTSLPKNLQDKVELVSGSVRQVVEKINAAVLNNYI